MTELEVCECGHDATTHGVTEPGCSARCLCDTCPAGNGNDCWCAGFRVVAAAGLGKRR